MRRGGCRAVLGVAGILAVGACSDGGPTPPDPSAATAATAAAAATAATVGEAGAAVGSAAAAPPPGGAGGAGRLTVTFDVDGAVTLKGTVGDATLPYPDGKAAATCADYARGGPGADGAAAFVLPLPGGGDVGGTRVTITVRVQEYTGPGLYTGDALTADGGRFGVRVGDTPYLRPEDGSGAIVTTEADGSGTFYFEKLTATGGDIAGRVSWTCR